MGWDHARSLERSKRKWDETEGLEVKKVVRETDFESIALKAPRLVVGAHVYVGISNYSSLLNGDKTDGEMLRLQHLWAREITRVVEKDFSGVKIHFQGPRVHAVMYRPIGNDSEIATRAVLMAAAIRAATSVFNSVHGLDDGRWVTAGGVDIGEAVATKSGVGGDRELLFLGNAANRAAKIIATSLRVTGDAAELVADDAAGYLVDCGADVYRFAASAAQLEALFAARGWSWTAEGCRNRIEADALNITVDAVKVYDAALAFKKEDLGLSNSKRVVGVSLFADVDGFTSYVAEEQANDRIDGAVRAWHVIRAETRETLVTDFNGFRVQYQGDRIQGLIYLPIGDESAVAVQAVRIAAALNSAVTNVLPDVIGHAAKPLAIGLALGTTLVSRIGEHGDRDTVCLAPATAEGARIQQALEGRVIGVDTALFEVLPQWLANEFAWDNTVKAYVLADLTLDELERLEAQQGGSAKSLLAVGAAAATVGAVIAQKRLRDRPLRPYGR